MQRKHRLSRSRDFDAVYRRGRSVSTRFLTLYWFSRPDEPGEPRLGLAVPKAAGNAVVRNRIKRQLREIWRAKLDRGAIDAGNDYVLVVRPGLPEATEARGFEWLAERVDEALGKMTARPAGRESDALAEHGSAGLGGGLVKIVSMVFRSLFTGPGVAGAPTCKYHPSCSQYASDAVRKYGPVKGLLKAAWRLLRCNPWSRGGVDYA